MIPLHWAVVAENTNVEVLFAMIEHFTEGLLELDNEGLTPSMRYALNKNKEQEIEEVIVELTEVARTQRKQKMIEKEATSRKAQNKARDLSRIPTGLLSQGHSRVSSRGSSRQKSSRGHHLPALHLSRVGSKLDHNHNNSFDQSHRSHDHHNHHFSIPDTS